MENIKSVLSVVGDNLEYQGVLDIVEFTRNPYTKTEIKNNTIYTSESGEAGACQAKIKVLVGSPADNYFMSKEGLTSGSYSLTIGNTFFRATSACDDLIDFFGSQNATMTATSTVAETQPNFSREASPADRMTRIYTIIGRCDVQPNVISA